MAHEASTRSAPEWLLLVMWRRKWLILASVLLGGLVGFGYLKLATPMYAGKAKISVQQLGPLLNPAMANQPGNENFRQTQRDLITSEPVLSAASVRIGKNSTLARNPRPPVQQMRELIATDLDRSNDVITVTAVALNGTEAATMANEVVKAYMAYQTDQSHRSTTGEKLETLEAMVRKTESELTDINQQMRQLEQEHGMLSQKDDRANQVMRRLQMLSDSLIESQRETINAKSVFEEAKRVLGPRASALDNPTTRPDGSDNDALGLGSEDPTLIRAEILQTQALLAELQQRYLPNHPSVISLKRRLERRNYDFVRAVEIRFRVTEQKESEYQKRYNEAQMQAIEGSKYVAEYTRLQEKADRLKKSLDDRSQKIQDIELLKKAGVLSIDVHEWAEAEPKPSLPNPRTTLPIALAIGLMGGLLFSCIWEWVDDRFHSPRDMRASLGMPLLAVIPQSATKRSPSVLGQRILLDPASDAAEAYRALRTAVQFAAPPGQMRTLLITSPSAGDGKTTLVSNLAIAMAQSGKRVIVVDADLRKPTQHEIFGVKNSSGLSMLLAGRCSLETATQRASVQGLDILPCGPAPANPSEILNSNEFGDVLEQLAEKYDYVMLDSPPVSAVPDARTMAGLCDGTLIVLKAQTAHRRQTEQTRDALLSVGAKVIGLVVNDVPQRTRRNYGDGAATQRRLVSGLTSQDQAETFPVRAK